MTNLTPVFAAMNGRDKWETLVLSGLVGTDEPWIAAMTETLRTEADRIEALESALVNLVNAIEAPRCSAIATLSRSHGDTK